jgi:uncharacterized delta-60 repeat protein
MTMRAAVLLALALLVPACGGGGGGGGGGGATLPAAPGGLAAVWGNQQASLSWTASAGAASYNVYRATVSGGPYAVAGNTASTAYVDGGLTNGTTYYYVVRAVNAAGESGPSAEVSGAPNTVPAAPTGVGAVGGDGQIDLTWGVVASVTGYRIERSLVSGGPYAVVTTVASTSHTDGGLANGTTYYYVVRGVNGSVIGPASSEVSATPAAVTTFNHARGVDYQVWAIARATDATNDVYVGGELRSFAGQPVGGICRLDSNGTYDAGFVMGLGTRTGHVRAIAPVSDGDVYIGGNFVEYNLTPVNRIVRLDANGAIDAGFDVGTGFNGQVNVITPDGAGNIYVGGTFTTYKGTTVNRIVRLTSAGAIDTAFDVGTGFPTGSVVHEITVDGSGNVLVGGQFTEFNGTTGLGNIVRLIGGSGATAGDIDATFTATSNGQIHAIAVAADGTGDLFVGGTFSTFNSAPQGRLIRITSTGTKVAAFDVGGGFNSDVNGLVASGSGVYVGGLFTAYQGNAVGRVVRLDDTGAIDASFATGTGFNSDVLTLAPDGSGGLLVGGFFTGYNGVGVDRAAQLTSTGTLVNLPTGAGFSHPVNAVAFVPSTTDIYVGGSFTHYDGVSKRGLVRLNSDGTIDATLDVGTGFVGSVNALAVAPDGDLYVGGSMTSYKGTSIGLGLVRLNPDGTIDNGFDIGSFPNIGFNGTVWAMAMAPDATGDIYVAGQFTTWKGTTANRIVRLDPAGTIVGSFATGTGFDAGVFALAVDGGGNVIAAGDFTAYAGSTPAPTRIARLGPTGAIDAAFSTATGTGFNGTVNALAIDASGNIYAAGGFTQFNGGTANRVVRLNPDGTVDATFNTGTGFNGLANALAVAPGNDVYVGGSFSLYKSSAVRPLVRLNSDGSVDGGFPASIPATTYAPGTVTVVALLPDASGRLYMGGNVTTWTATTMDFLARLTSSGAVE